jgi:hypothetical protein
MSIWNVDYRYWVWVIDMVILDIDMGYLVTLVQPAPPRQVDDHGGQQHDGAAPASRRVRLQLQLLLHHRVVAAQVESQSKV